MVDLTKGKETAKKSLKERPVVTGFLAVLGIAILWLIFNVWTSVSVGEKKVEVCFNKVTERTYTNGYHLVKPLCSYDNFNTQKRKDTIEDVAIPTQDRYNSTGTVVVEYTINTNRLTYIREEIGGEELFKQKTFDVYIPNIIKSEGRKVEDNKFLAQDATIIDMQNHAQERLQEKMGDLVIIHAVYIQDIVYDSRIAKLIQATKERTEAEEVEKSQLRIDETKAQKKVKVEKAASEAALYAKTKREHDADAKYYEQQKDAEAALYAKQQEAKGIEAVGKALKANPKFMEYMDKEIQAVRAEKWDGNETLTTNQYVVPVKKM